jgi:DHA1 family bicyclomycin/chloramphenicol resistance-like MFS transporter
LFVGLLIYAAAAVGCAFSPNIYFLIGIRFILAFGGCVGMVAGRAVVRDLFPTNEIAGIFSSLMLVMGHCPYCSPYTWRLYHHSFWVAFYFYYPYSFLHRHLIYSALFFTPE